jgi:hypothetical protein
MQYYIKEVFNLHFVVWQVSSNMMEAESCSRMLAWYVHLADNVVSSEGNSMNVHHQKSLARTHVCVCDVDVHRIYSE